MCILHMCKRALNGTQSVHNESKQEKWGKDEKKTMLVRL